MERLPLWGIIARGDHFGSGKVTLASLANHGTSSSLGNHRQGRSLRQWEGNSGKSGQPWVI